MPEESGYETLDDILQDIADALRDKLGTDDPIDAQYFSTLIRSL